MGRFLSYAPEQAYLLPPSVQDELGARHLCFFIHQTVEHLDLRQFEQEYSEEGGALYHPAPMFLIISNLLPGGRNAKQSWHSPSHSAAQNFSASGQLEKDSNHALPL